MKFHLGLLSSIALSQMSFAEVDLEPITYDLAIWETAPSAYSENFPAYGWKSSDSVISSGVSDLKIWDQTVESVTLHGTEKTECLNITLLSQATLSGSKPEKLMVDHTTWKNLLDKEFKKTGTRKPTVTLNGAKVGRTDWVTDKSTISLIAKRSATNFPELLSLAIYAPGAELPQSAMESASAQSGEAIITKELKGLTSYLSGGKYKKKDITKDPEFYLLYFAASW